MSNYLKRLNFVVTLIKNNLETAQTAAVIGAVWDVNRKSASPKSFEEVTSLVSLNLPMYRDKVLKFKQKSFNLYLYWTVEKLDNALRIVDGLDLNKITTLRRYKKQTRKVFEDQLKQIQKQLKGGTASVLNNIKEIFNSSEENDVSLLNLAGAIDRRCKFSLRVLWVLQHRVLKFMALDIRIWQILIAGMVLVPVMYLYYKSGVDPNLSIPQRFLSDTTELTVILTQDTSIVNRVIRAVEFIISLVSAAPVLLMAVTIPLMLLRRYFFRSASLNERIAKKEEELRDLAQSLKLPINSFISIGGIDMSTKTITIKKSTINAPVTLADSIQDSINTLASGETDNDAKELTEELLKRIAEIGSVWGGALGQVSRDSKNLSAEIASEKPRRKWYELSIDGIKEAATAIGEAGKPVIETVEKLLPILIKLFP